MNLTGKVGTLQKDKFEEDVNEALCTYRIGEVIKIIRLEQNLTQEELGKRGGVKKAQISKFEKGKGLGLSSMRRVFKALGITTETLDLGNAGKIVLW